MISKHLEQKQASVGVSQQLFFAGDNVRLAGQIDYPTSDIPPDGFPLIFIIQHATCNSRRGYKHVARLGTESGFAVFTWDKRNTGSSGAGGGGSVVVDTLSAYYTALTQPGVNRSQTVILAQNEGSLLLGDAFAEFADIQHPAGVLLMGNMLDDKRIKTLEAPAHIVVSKNDWNAWQIYAEGAAKAHASATGYPTTFYVAPNTNRRLMYTNGGTFHKGTARSISEWLKTIKPLSATN